MSEKITLVVPNEDNFKPAKIPFGVVTGKGVPDYDNIKSNGKRGGFNYAVTLDLTKDMAKDIKAEVLHFWEDNKPKKSGKKPKNFDNIIRKDDKGLRLYTKTKVEFDGTQNVIPIVNHEGSKLDPNEYGNIGNGSEGRVSVTLAIYGTDSDAGVSVYLNAVKLTKFVPYAPSGTANFGSEEGEVESEGNFKKEKKKKKKK